MVIDYALQCLVDAAPLAEELGEDFRSLAGELIESLFPFVFFAPLAFEKSLGFEAPQQRIKSVLVDGDSEVGKRFAENVTVLLLAELSHNSEDEGAATEFEAKIFEGFFSG